MSPLAPVEHEAWDPTIQAIADYVVDYEVGEAARDAARYCLMDALGCAIAALASDECHRRLGPIVPGASLAGGARVPGTPYELDPVCAAWNLGCMVRWLDYNDTWLALEWGHPSDNLGALLASADYRARRARVRGESPPDLRTLLDWLVRAYEVQGVLALGNSFNRRGLDHVVLVRIASAAVATEILGGDREQVRVAVSNALLDGAPLRTYRHGTSTGWRKSWAAADATARGVHLALMALRGEMGYPQALSAPEWGLEAVLLDAEPLRLIRPLGSYVVENILFKVAYPVEFHAQTAVECALRLHGRLAARLAEVRAIKLATQSAALRIIDKPGPWRNPADRDHSLQYAVAVALLYGDLARDHYDEVTASDPRIQALCAQMEVVEEPRYSRDYLDPAKRAIPNRVNVTLADGTRLDEVVDYPLGHPRRRQEALPLLASKLVHNLEGLYDPETVTDLLDLFADRHRLEAMPVDRFVDLWTAKGRR